MLRAIPLWQVGVLAGLLLWLYWSTLVHLVGQWWNDPNFSHGFFVPLFSAFVIWQERDRLARIPSAAVLVRPGRACWQALGVLIVGRLGAELFLARSSLLLVLAGVVILFLGWNLFRAVLFPWAFLLLMIPIPTIVFNQITFPLQLLASQVSAAVLPSVGVPFLREGNVINLASMAAGSRRSLQRHSLPDVSGDPRHHLRLPDGKAALGALVARSGLGADRRRRQLRPHHRNRIAGPVLGTPTRPKAISTRPGDGSSSSFPCSCSTLCTDWSASCSPRKGASSTRASLL